MASKRTSSVALAAGASNRNPSSRYVIVGANHGSNDIQVWEYGGYAPGPRFSYVYTQCGSLTLLESGTPLVGNTLTFTVANGALSGTIFGYPGFIPLTSLGCNCSRGVQNGLFFGNPLVWTIPANPIFVGTALAVQGYTVLGSNCLSTFDLSDTVNFTIH
ncbi:MAG: hypothetical protein ABIP94_03340 [Planctomycetota bacterium]